MSHFNKCFEHIIGVEGGYSNNPYDKGGATKYGITIGTLSKWRGETQTNRDVRDLMLDEAMAIYKEKYWDVWGLDTVNNYNVCLVLFDQAVNWGVGKRTVMRIQKVANLFLKTKLKPDGIWGKKTHGGVKKLKDKFAFEFILASQDQYVSLAKRDRSQLVFLSGWINRTQELLRKVCNV